MQLVWLCYLPVPHFDSVELEAFSLSWEGRHRHPANSAGFKLILVVTVGVGVMNRHFHVAVVFTTPVPATKEAVPITIIEFHFNSD